MKNQLFISPNRGRFTEEAATQGPHSQILMTGGPTEVHILYPKQLQLQNLSLQKYHYFFSIPKKIPLFFLATQKNPGIFYRPKTITFGQNFRPKKSLGTPLPPSLKYVSGAPGGCKRIWSVNDKYCHSSSQMHLRSCRLQRRRSALQVQLKPTEIGLRLHITNQNTAVFLCER